LIALLFAFFLLPLAQATDFYVATNGSDSAGSGSITNPYATVQKAITIARVQGKTVPKRVVIRGGNYWNQTIYMHGYYDGNITLTAYPGETPILYGGQPLTNWIDTGTNGCWVAALGAFPTLNSSVSALTNWQPRMLLADGIMCYRARLPETGKFHYTSLSGASLIYTNDFPATTNMEVIFDNSWNDNEMAVVAIYTGTKTLTLHAPVSGRQNLGTGTGTTSFSAVNIPEGMTKEIQFWWNKTNNTVIFKPWAGKNPNSMTIIVPTTDTIVYITSSGGGASLAQNICFSNLTFSVSTATIGVGNKDDNGENYRGAITSVDTTNLVFDGCTFRGLGGHAIKSAYSGYVSYDTVIRNCVIHDLGVCGALLRTTHNAVATNNLIYNLGYLCQGAAGLVSPPEGLFTADHNTITNVPSDGILVAGSLGNNTNLTAHVYSNWVQHVCTGLRDLGGVHLENGTNFQVVGNYFADIAGTNDDNNTVWSPFLMGIYADFYTVNAVISNNIVYNCTHPVMYYQSTNYVWANNFFVNTRAENSTFYFESADRPTWQRNICSTKNTPLIYYVPVLPTLVNSNLCVADWHRNIVWSTTSLNNNPMNATTADPLFVKVPTNLPRYLNDADFSFQAGSPAPGLGIYPLSLIGIGCSGSQLKGVLLPASELHVLPPGP
jgi:hypothetical protein